MLRGDFGRSFEWNRPVGELLVERLPLTIIISSFSMVFIYGVGVPIGMYSALHQYSVVTMHLPFSVSSASPRRTFFWL